MKKTITFFVTLVLVVGILSACNSSNNQGSSSNKNKNDESSQVNGNTNNSTEQDSGNADKENTEKKEENSNNPSATGNFKDQTDLKIGDTGKAESTVGKYEITIHSVKMKDEIEGQAPMFDHLFIAEITVKNIGDQPIDAIEPIKTLEFSSELNGSGTEDYSSYFNSIKTFSGKLQPGESVKGEAVFDGADSKKYYIRTNVGLVSSKAVKNKTTWTFEKSEAK